MNDTERIKAIRQRMPKDLVAISNLTLGFLPNMTENQEYMFWQNLESCYLSGRAAVSEESLLHFIRTGIGDKFYGHDHTCAIRENGSCDCEMSDGAI